MGIYKFMLCLLYVEGDVVKEMSGYVVVEVYLKMLLLKMSFFRS